MPSLEQPVGQVGTPRKLGVIAVVFAAIVACLLVLVHGAIDTMTGVRAFVGGESHWSKAQKQAVLALARAAEGDRRALAAFRTAITVPLGDRAARRELERAHPDLEIARRGLLAGRNHPDDIGRMIRVFRLLRNAPYVADAIVAWRAADREAGRLLALAAALERELLREPVTPRTTAAFRRKLEIIDDRVTPYADAFSAALGEGARLLAWGIPIVLTTAAVLLVGLALALTRILARAVRRSETRARDVAAALGQEARIAGALAQVARELISALETPVLYDRLCQVSASVIGGTASMTLLWQDATATYAPVAAFGDPLPLEAKRAALGAGAPALRAESLRALDAHTLAITLRNGADTVGVQLVTTAEPVGREHLRIGEGVAAIAAIALANANLIGRLAEASRLKSEFVSTMSHELRTPLNVMLGYAEMVREAASDGERAELLERIDAAGRDLLELIESTLEIGRIEAGRDAARFEATTLRALLGAIGQGCARLPRRSEVDLRWPADLPDAPLTTDPRKVTVILRNLVGNALKFTERGFVAVEATVDPDMVTLVVRDTGIGIRREDQRHVFEMFRQADGSDTRRFGGTGLGLYIVRRFVQQLDGAITLESEPGKGAAFTIVLPRVPAPDAVSTAA